MVVVATVLVDESSHGIMGENAVKDALRTVDFNMQLIALTVAYFNMLIGAWVM